MTGAVEAVADLIHQPRVHPGRPELAHLVDERTVDEVFGGVEPDAPEIVAERVRDLDRGADRVVLEVHEHRDVHLFRELPCKGLCGGDGAARVRRDQPVRHCPDASPTPPRRLGVGGHADGARDVRGPAVTGLDEPVIVPGGEEEDLLVAGGLLHLGHVAHHERAARQTAEVGGLEVREQRVVALDLQHGLPRRDLVALVERPHLELVPAGLPAAVRAAPGALLEDRDRLIDPAEDRAALLEDLHQDARVAALALEQLLREVEVSVAVVALAEALDGETEHIRVQPLAHRR